MMQRLLQVRVLRCLFLLGFFAIPAAAQPADVDTLWFEDWEGDWTNDWFADAGTWEVGEPTIGPDSAFNGTNVAATVLDGNYGINQNTRLVRIDPFNVPAASENPRLRFWHWFQFGGGGDFGEVEISTDRGSTWETILGPYSGNSSSIWTRPFANLSSYANETVQVAFRLAAGSSSQGPGWYIDEVGIFCGDDPCSDIVIPVELAAFDAVADGADVLLQWSTASETNNAGFAVERKAEHGGGFEQIGFVEGAGTTNEAQTYRFTDSALLFEAERLTYRLKQVDFDGAFEYSPEVEIMMGVPKEFVLHGNVPNPFGERTRLRYELPQSGDVRLTVYNVLGQRVATVVEEHQEAGRKEVVFDARGLASGVYVLRLEAAGRMQTQKVTVVR